MCVDITNKLNLYSDSKTSSDFYIYSGEVSKILIINAYSGFPLLINLYDRFEQAGKKITNPVRLNIWSIIYI